MRKFSQKAVKITIRSIVAVLLCSALVLSGVGIYFANNRTKSPTVVDPLEWSTDKFDGEYDSASGQSGYNNGNDYANRGDMTYTIDSVDSFIYFIDTVNDPIESAKKNYFSGYTIYLNKNLDLNGYEIDSIGVLDDYDRPTFQGTFDGSYYTISNAKINGNGLFAYTRNATIKNIGLYDCTVNSTEQYTGGILGYAENPTVSNVYIHGGSVNSTASNNTTAGLIGTLAVSTAYIDSVISNSFSTTSLNGNTTAGIIANIVDLNYDETSETDPVDITLNISYAYYTNSGTQVSSKPEHVTIETNDTVLANPTKNSFISWPTYKSKYDLSYDWCDYSCMENSSVKSFTLPIQTGFNKVFMTGSGYEAVVSKDDETLDSTSISQVFTGMESNETAEINVIVEQVYISEPAVATEGNITLTATTDTTFYRADDEVENMIVSTTNSTLTLGTTDGATITFDGQSDTRDTSKNGTAVIANGEDFEIVGNVVIQNNENNTTKYGGGLLIYAITAGQTEEESEFLQLNNLTINNCSAEYGGGLCVLADSTYSGENVIVSNCSADNGGCIYYSNGADDGNTVVNVVGKTAYSLLISKNPISLLTSAVTYSSGINNFTGTATGGSATSGGGISASSGILNIYNQAKIYSNSASYGGGIYATSWNSGKYYSDSVVNISDEVEIYSNTASNGGGIYCASHINISDEVKIHLNTATLSSGIRGYGGGIYFSETIHGDTGAQTSSLSGASTARIYDNTASTAGNNTYGLGSIIFRLYYTSSQYNSYTVYYLDTITKDDTPVTRSGYDLAGFSNTPNSTSLYSGYYTNTYTTGTIISYAVYKRTWTFRYGLDGTDSYSAVSYYSVSTAIVNASTSLTYTPPEITGYAFAGWKTSTSGASASGSTATLTSASGTFTATYETAYYEVTFRANNSRYGSVSLSSLSVPYGSTITVNSNRITINGTTVTATANSATTASSYHFSSWTNASGTITADRTIIAYFTNSANTYTLTIDPVLEDASIPLQSVEGDYGSGYSIYKNLYEPINVSGFMFLSGNAYSTQRIRAAGAYFDGIMSFNTSLSTARSVFKPNTTYTVVYEIITSQFHAYNEPVRIVIGGENDIIASGSSYITTTSGNDSRAVYTSSFTTKSNFNDSSITTGLNSYMDIGTNYIGNFQFRISIFEGDDILDEISASNFQYVDLDLLAVLPKITAEGYEFLGWYTAETGGSRVISGVLEGDTTVYAHWEVLEYDLTIDPNGGTYNGTTNNTIITQNYGTTYTVGTPTRAGYTFTGWTKSGAGTLSGSRYTFGAGDGTLTANWEANQYTLTIDPNGGTYNGTTSTTEIIQDCGTTYLVLTPTRAGYTFTGWTRSGSGTLSGNTFTFGAGNGSLTANWNVDYCIVTFAVSNSSYGSVNRTSLSVPYGSSISTSSNTVTINGTTTTATPTTVTGYTTTFTGWSNASGTVTGAITITANFSRSINSYTLTIDPNGGTYNNTTNDTTVTQNYNTTYTVGTPTRTGYTFTGWTRSGSGTLSGNTFTFGAGDGTLTANWERKTYRLSLDANDGDLTGNSYVDVTYGLMDYNSISTLVSASRTGYTFTGWADSSGDLVYDADGNAEVGTYWNSSKQWNRDLGANGTSMTIYAQWERAEYYLDLNGNINGTGQSNISNAGTARVLIREPGESSFTTVNSSCTDYYTQWPYETEYQIVVTVSNSAQYYVGTSSDCDQSTYTFTGTIGAGNVTVTAYFITREYTVNFYSSSATSGVVTQTLPYGTTLTLNSNKTTTVGSQTIASTITINGETLNLVGWSTGVDTVAEWTSGSLSVGGDVNYYAVWDGDYITSSNNSSSVSSYGSTITATLRSTSSESTAYNAYRQTYYTYNTGYYNQNHSYNFVYHSGSSSNSTTNTYYRLINNGATGSWQTSIPDLVLTIPWTTAELDGYELAGWSTNGADATVEWEEDDGANNVDSSVTYYAVWYGNYVTSTGNDSSTSAYGDTITAALRGTASGTTATFEAYRQSYYVYNTGYYNQNHSYNLASHSGSQTNSTTATYYRLINNNSTGAWSTSVPSLTLTIPWTTATLSGYSFVGWSTNGADTAAEWTSGTRNVTSNVTYYGVWNGDYVTRTNISSNVTTYGSTITASLYETPDNLVEDSYTSTIQTYYKYDQGYYDQNHSYNLTSHSGSQTNSAEYDRQYRLVNNGSTGAWQSSVPTLTLTIPWVEGTLSGYDFYGWSTDGENATAEWTSGTRSVTSDVTYYAVYVRRVYNNTTLVGTAYYPYNSTANATHSITTKTPTKDGFTFEGYTSSSSVTANTETRPSTVTTANVVRTTAGSTTVYALYSRTWTFNYGLTGASTHTITAYYPYSVNTNASYSKTYNPGDVTGYTFNSWTTTTSGATVSGTTATLTVATGTFTATYNIVYYNVTIGVNNATYGSVNEDSLSVPYNSTITVNNNIITIANNTVAYNETVTATSASQTAQYEYNFANWTVGGNTISSSNGNNVITGETTITANFTRSTRLYTISIVAGENGSVTAGEILNVPYGSNIEISSNRIIVSGRHDDGTSVNQTVTANPNAQTTERVFAFSKWTNTTSSTAIDLNSGAQIELQGNIELTANFTWSWRQYTVRFELDSVSTGRGTFSANELVVSYGSKISVNGATISIKRDDETTAKTTTATSIEKNEFIFDSWSVSDGALVTGDMTITANFAVLNELAYTIIGAESGNSYSFAIYEEDGRTLAENRTISSTSGREYIHENYVVKIVANTTTDTDAGTYQIMYVYNGDNLLLNTASNLTDAVSGNAISMANDQTIRLEFKDGYVVESTSTRTDADVSATIRTVDENDSVALGEETVIVTDADIVISVPKSADGTGYFYAGFEYTIGSNSSIVYSYGTTTGNFKLTETENAYEYSAAGISPNEIKVLSYEEVIIETTAFDNSLNNYTYTFTNKLADDDTGFVVSYGITSSDTSNGWRLFAGTWTITIDESADNSILNTLAGELGEYGASLGDGFITIYIG